MHWGINIAQASRSPSDKGSSKSLRNYVRKLHGNVDSMVPWEKQNKFERLKSLKENSKPVDGKQALKTSEELVNKLRL